MLKAVRTARRCVGAALGQVHSLFGNIEDILLIAQQFIIQASAPAPVANHAHRKRFLASSRILNQLSEGKSESRGWKYARFLMSCLGFCMVSSCMEPKLRAVSDGFEKALEGQDHPTRFK